MEKFDYQGALLFYLEHGQSRFLKQQFAKGQTAWSERRLAEEVAKLKQRVTVQVPISPQQPERVEPKILDFYTLPDNVQKLIERRNELRKKIAYQFTLLHSHPTDAQRAEGIRLILEMDLEEDALQQKVDHFYSHGHIPDDPLPERVPDTKEAAELMRRMMTLRANISRDKRKNKDISQWKAELDSIEKKLKYAV